MDYNNTPLTHYGVWSREARVMQEIFLCQNILGYLS